jgi:tetratricopeptide (TPR) repeat protein
MGLCYIQMQQFGVALDCFQESLRIQPSDQSFDQLGRLYLLIQDFEKAEDLYLTACKYAISIPNSIIINSITIY